MLGKNFLLVPGPSNMPERILLAMTVSLTSGTRHSKAAGQLSQTGHLGGLHELMPMSERYGAEVAVLDTAFIVKPNSGVGVSRAGWPICFAPKSIGG